MRNSKPNMEHDVIPNTPLGWLETRPPDLQDIPHMEKGAGPCKYIIFIGIKNP